MGSSVCDINQVQLTEQNGSYECKVFTEDSFLGGTICVILSKTRDTSDLVSRIAVSELWFGDYGTVTCDKNLLESIPYLYVYVLDSQKVSSNVVRVFLKAPKLLGYQVNGNGMLDLKLDTSSNDYKQAEKLVVEVSGAKKELKLPNCGVYLPELGIWEKDAKGILNLSFFSHNDNADVYGQTLENVAILLKGPIIDRLTVSESTILGTGDFSGSGKLLAEIKAGSYVAAQKEVIPVLSGSTYQFEWKLSEAYIDFSKRYTISLSYLNGTSVSLPGKDEELLLISPVLKEIAAYENGTRISLEQPSLYEITTKEGKKTEQGEHFSFSGSAGEVSFRIRQGKSYGPELKISNQCLRFQTFLWKNTQMYCLGEGAAEEPKKTIVIPLGVQLPEYEKGKVFLVAQGETESTLSIDIKYIDILLENPETLYDEYEEMLSVCAKDYETMELMTEVILEHMPLREEDILFFRYRYRGTEARVDLLAGMKLSVEYSIYQNIPEGQRMLLPKENLLEGFAEVSQISHVNGYVGAGTSEYQIVLREGNVMLEPFLQGYLKEGAYEVPAPSAIDSGARIDGGADGGDFLFAGMAKPFVRLLYPNKRIDRNNKGELRYFHNVCLAAAKDLEIMAEVSRSMRRQKLPEKLDEVSLAAIRGRASVTVKLLVFLNGNSHWVSLGTTVGDILDSLSVKGDAPPVLHRQIGGNMYPVFGKNLRGMYLISGDRVEVSMSAADNLRGGCVRP